MGPSSDAKTSEPDLSVTYPVNLLLEAKRCLVVGGGQVAVRKVAGLRAARADVTVVAPSIDPALSGDDDLTCVERPYQPGEVADYHLVITCTDNPAVNAQVAADGTEAGVWVNSADDPANCDFILPAVARNGPLQVTVSTGGQSPALAAWLCRRYERELDDNYLALLDLLAEVRQEVRSSFGTSEQPGWRQALDGPVIDLVLSGQIDSARRELRSRLGLPE